jgi:hypothetical protein
MTQNRIILFIFALFICTSTTFSKTTKAVTIQTEKDYIQEISFDFTYNIPIITVYINGKNYRFLFDTGMPSTISNELLNEHQFKKIDKNGFGIDVNNNRKQNSYYNIDEIKIAGISFNNTEASSNDLKNSFALKCLEIDGVIGNNFIKNAIWEIDYKKQIIRFTNNINLLTIPKNVQVLKFKIDKKRQKYIPKVTVKINGKKDTRIYFDTGSNAGFKLPHFQFSKVLNSKTSIQSFGNPTTGLYGAGKHKLYVDSKVATIELGDITLHNKIVSFNEHSRSIGNLFLKNYTVIINYNVQKIYLIKQQDYNWDTTNSFGVNYSIVNNKAIVTLIYKGTEAEKLLQLGDEILKINEQLLSELIENDACSLIMNSPLKKLETANLTFLRTGKKQTITLKKTLLIE